MTAVPDHFHDPILLRDVFSPETEQKRASSPGQRSGFKGLPFRRAAPLMMPELGRVCLARGKRPEKVAG